MKCPYCKGRGYKVSIMSSDEDSGGEPVAFSCYRCGKTGEVTDEDLKRVEDGKKIRADRFARGLTVMEEAKRRRITMTELMAQEYGARPGTYNS